MPAVSTSSLPDGEATDRCHLTVVIVTVSRVDWYQNVSCCGYATSIEAVSCGRRSLLDSMVLDSGNCLIGWPSLAICTYVARIHGRSDLLQACPSYVSATVSNDARPKPSTAVVIVRIPSGITTTAADAFRC